MRRDLIIGIIVSLLLHAGVAFGSKLFPDKKVAKVVVEDAPVIAVDLPPPLEPDPPEVVDLSDTPPPDLSDLVPPMQMDTPSAAMDTPFVQQMQPPPPPNFNKPAAVMKLPTSSAAMSGIGAGMKDLFDLADLDQAPVPTFRAEPVYPFEMKRAGIKGEVKVEFIVDAQGAVIQAYAVSSTDKEFEAPAVQAVKKWRFRPGKKGGRAVNVRMQVPIAFNLGDE